MDLLKSDPVLAWFALFAIVLVIALLASAIWGRAPKREAHAQTGKSTRFLGTQMDIAILIAGIVLLLATIGWICAALFQ